MTTRAIKVLLRHIHGDKPSCASKGQYENWLESASIHGSDLMSGFCTDCTQEYQYDMIRKGRCDYPQTYFVNGEGHNSKISEIRAKLRKGEA